MTSHISDERAFTSNLKKELWSVLIIRRQWALEIDTSKFYRLLSSILGVFSKTTVSDFTSGSKHLHGKSLKVHFLLILMLALLLFMAGLKHSLD